MDTSSRCLSFQDLKKETVGETYKHLNSLLKELNADTTSLRFLLATETNSLFDESIKLIIIDSCQLKDHVYSILLSQNNYQIKRILKCDWFFACPGTTEEFCKKVFPFVSFWLRNKLVNKLSKSCIKTDDAEILFMFIKKHYGRGQAELFLPKCSSEFIQRYFKEEKSIFCHSKSCKVLLTLCRRFPIIVMNFFSEVLSGTRTEYFNIRKLEKVFLFLASNHTNIFIPIFEKFHSKLLFLHFGYKLSKKLGPKIKTLVFTKSELLKSCAFNKSGLISSFDFNDRVKFFSSLVTFDRNQLSFLNWINSAYQFHLLLKLIKPGERLPLIESVFKQVYNLNIWDHMILCEPQVLEVIPLHARVLCAETYEKQLLTLAESKFESSDFYEGLENWQPLSDSQYFVYLHPFERAFPKYKTILLKAPSLFTRQDIIESMVRNCSVNKDQKNLEELAKFVVNRFRNDSPSIFIQFMNGVFRSFPLKVLSNRVMENIEEMLHICFVKNERHSYEYLLEKCMLYRLDNNSDVTDQVKHIVDWSITDMRFRQPFIHDCKAERSRELFFKFYLEIISRMKDESNAETLELFTTWTVNTLKEYNRKNKKKPIRLSHVLDLLHYQIILMKKCSGFKVLDDVSSIINVQDSQSIFLLEKSPNKLIGRILKQRPSAIVGKLPSLIKYLVSVYRTDKNIQYLFRASVKIFSFMGVMLDVLKIITDEFCNGNSTQTKKSALIMISHVYTLKDFEKLIENYMPKGEKIDLMASKEFTEIQLLIPSVIKNLTPSWKNIQLIFKFFSGDFFPLVLTSFYTCCYQTRVDDLIRMLLQYLHELPKNFKIAVAKELIRVLLNVSDLQEVVSVCLQCWNMFDHYSIRTILLKKLSCIFLEWPTRDTFDLLKRFINDCDEIVIDERPKVQDVCAEFYADYVLTLWNFSENQQFRIKNEIRNSIVSDVKISDVRLLPNNFCQDVIKTNLFANNLDVKQFTSYYLIGYSDTMDERIRFVMEVLKGSEADARDVSNFFKVLRSTALTKTSFASELFEGILKNWPYTDKTVLYDDRLINYHHYIYHKIWKTSNELTNDEKSEKFGRQLNIFYCSHPNLVYLTPIFLEVLKIFINELDSHGQVFNSLIALKELLKNSNDTSLAILVISILPDDKVKLYKTKKRTFSESERKQKQEMNELLQVVNNFQDEVVSIYFNRKFGINHRIN